jgi:hypothetical protein
MKTKQKFESANMLWVYKFQNDDADFFVQLKGDNAEKPLPVKIPNSIGIVVNPDVLDETYFYYLMLAVWQSKYYQNFIKGSVIKYITHHDISKVLIQFANLPKFFLTTIFI